MKPATRFTEIDLLRFLAALAVMFGHYCIRGFVDGDTLSPLHFPTLGQAVKYNYLGVNLFFMISGFVILMSVQGKTLKGFVVSRLVRLYPAYWVACTLTFIVIVLFVREKIPVTFPRYLVNMTMLNEFFFIGSIDGLYWTLCTELKFYILVGMLVVTRQISRIQLYLGLWLLIAIIQLKYPSATIAYLFIPEYCAYFVAGSVFYLLHKEGFEPYKIALLISSFAVAALYDVRGMIERITWYQFDFSIPALLAILATFYMVFLLIILKKNRPHGGEAVFVYLGTLSYPLYLVHNNIGIAIFNKLHTVVGRYYLLFGTMCAMLVLAHLIHVQVENRFSPKFKRWLERLLPGPGLSKA